MKKYLCVIIGFMLLVVVVLMPFTACDTAQSPSEHQLIVYSNSSGVQHTYEAQPLREQEVKNWIYNEYLPEYRYVVGKNALGLTVTEQSMQSSDVDAIHMLCLDNYYYLSVAMHMDTWICRYPYFSSEALNEEKPHMLTNAPCYGFLKIDQGHGYAFTGAYVDSTDKQQSAAMHRLTSDGAIQQVVAFTDEPLAFCLNEDTENKIIYVVTASQILSIREKQVTILAELSFLKNMFITSVVEEEGILYIGAACGVIAFHLENQSYRWYPMSTLPDVPPSKENDLKIEISPSDKSLIDLSSVTYDEAQLLEIVQYNGSINELDAQYPIECLRWDDKVYRVSYLGDESVAVVLFDDLGNKLLGNIYSINRVKSDFEELEKGQTLADVRKVDPDGEYLFLFTGSNETPKVSSHYTKDGYLITIEYDNSNAIINITKELM